MARNETPNAFVEACSNNNLAEVERLIKAGEDVNQIDTSQPGISLRFTGLMVAMRDRNLPLARLLLENGADPYLAPPKGAGLQKITAIEAAAMANFVDGLKLIREFGHEELVGWEGDAKDSLIFLALMGAHHAAKRGETPSLDMLTYLVEERGLDINYTSPRNLTAIVMACAEKLPAAFLEYCYKKGVARNKQAETLIPRAKASFSAEAEDKAELLSGVPDLFARMGELSDKYATNTLPINISVYHGSLEQVEIHLIYGANPLLEDRNGNNAFTVLDDLANSGLPRAYKRAHEDIGRRLIHHTGGLRRPKDGTLPHFRTRPKDGLDS